MLYCPVRASRAMLIGPGYVLSEVVVRCLSIAQHAPVQELEPWFIPQVQPCDRTMLNSALRWSVTSWRGAVFYHRRPVINPGDRIVVDGVPIGSHVGMSIGFVAACCLTAAWNVVAWLFRPRGNSKPIIIVRCSSYSWVGCSRSSSSLAVNGNVLNMNRMFIRNFSL
jgi:hypothetical protein